MMVLNGDQSWQCDAGRQSLLSSVVDAVVSGIMVVDSQRRVVVWNRWMEDTTGIASEQAMNVPLQVLFPQLVDKRILGAIDDALERGTSALMSHAFLKTPFPLYSKQHSGEQIKQVVFVKPVDVNGDGGRHCVVQINDVTSAVRRERQLRDIAAEAQAARQAAEELSHLKSSFISTVSHELRTPLTSIRGSLGLLNGALAGELTPPAASLVEIAHKNTLRLLLLINDILDIEKIESGRMSYSFKPFEIKSLIHHAIEANAGYAEQHGVSFKVVSCPDTLKVNGDFDRLMQVMNNLMSNAAKFEPYGGVVDVAVDFDQERVVISVKDHGPGVPASFRDRIFDKFTQADDTDSRKIGGTGLGLAIAKAIVEHHNGYLAFNSEPGEGANFFFDLPIIQGCSEVS